MRFRKECLSLFLTAMLLLGLLCSGYAQTKKEPVILLPGIIEQISGDLRFLVVNETRIFISPETRVIDEKGKVWGLSELKPGTSIIIEVVRYASGFLAKQIVLQSPKR